MFKAPYFLLFIVRTHQCRGLFCKPTNGTRQWKSYPSGSAQPDPVETTRRNLEYRSCVDSECLSFCLLPTVSLHSVHGAKGTCSCNFQPQLVLAVVPSRYRNEMCISATRATSWMTKECLALSAERTQSDNFFCVSWSEMSHR